MKICIFERSNEKNHFSKTEIYFHKKTTPQLSGHVALPNVKVGLKSNFGRLATNLCDGCWHPLLSIKRLNGFVLCIQG